MRNVSSGDAITKIGVRFRLLFMVMFLVAVAIFAFGKINWGYKTVPVDPEATAAVIDYLHTDGTHLQFRDQQGRCGQVKDGLGFVRYIVDEKKRRSYGYFRAREVL
ncbi:hypothetical protein [Stutzerimonas zhaodongensis]|uniref:hypothetical protein n=1 Tax=Stutzerimonas TaxID=2901164 RepID=UPI0038901DC3